MDLWHNLSESSSVGSFAPKCRAGVLGLVSPGTSIRSIKTAYADETYLNNHNTWNDPSRDLSSSLPFTPPNAHSPTRPYIPLPPSPRSPAPSLLNTHHPISSLPPQPPKQPPTLGTSYLPSHPIPRLPAPDLLCSRTASTRPKRTNRHASRVPPAPPRVLSEEPRTARPGLAQPKRPSALSGRRRQKSGLESRSPSPPRAPRGERHGAA